MKNYIEEFMKDNDLTINEKFIVHCSDFKLIVKINSYSEIECIEKIRGSFVNFCLHDFIIGDYGIGKIKPKTLTEQLKEQGFGWLVKAYGEIDRINFNEPLHDKYLKDWATQGNMFLTKYDAEREVYRRKLEFEMQEWARENDCFMDGRGWYRVADCFNVYVNSIESHCHTYSNFEDKIQKYYDWKCE